VTSTSRTARSRSVTALPSTARKSVSVTAAATPPAMSI
jgi:hypothetical protein